MVEGKTDDSYTVDVLNFYSDLGVAIRVHALHMNSLKHVLATKHPATLSLPFNIRGTTPISELVVASSEYVLHINSPFSRSRLSVLFLGTNWSLETSSRDPIVHTRGGTSPYSNIILLLLKAMANKHSVQNVFNKDQMFTNVTTYQQFSIIFIYHNIPNKTVVHCQYNAKDPKSIIWRCTRWFSLLTRVQQALKGALKKYRDAVCCKL